MGSWDLLDTGTRSASENMAIDQMLLESLSERTNPLLHIYRWSRPSITYGYFADPAQWLDLDAIEELSIDLAKRPTGGGLTIHIGDLAFSAFVPATHSRFSCCTLENYAYINRAVVEAVSACCQIGELQLLIEAPEPEQEEKRHFCMAHPTKYDVVIGGKKVGGAAQRRTKDGFLHHGTICLSVPNQGLLERLFKKDKAQSLLQAITSTSFALSADASDATLTMLRESLLDALFTSLQRR